MQAFNVLNYKSFIARQKRWNHLIEKELVEFVGSYNAGLKARVVGQTTETEALLNKPKPTAGTKTKRGYWSVLSVHRVATQWKWRVNICIIQQESCLVWLSDWRRKKGEEEILDERGRYREAREIETLMDTGWARDAWYATLEWRQCTIKLVSMSDVLLETRMQVVVKTKLVQETWLMICNFEPSEDECGYFNGDLQNSISLL